jgi:hypothetical protein
MTVDGLFGPIEITAPKQRQIRFKTIKAVYETLTVAEGTGNYLVSVRKPHFSELRDIERTKTG